MSNKLDTPNTSWAIQTAFGGSAGVTVVIGIQLFYLLNVKTQIYFTGRIISISAGAGAGVKGLTISNSGHTFFTTSEPIKAEDFAGGITIATAEFATPILGRAACWGTFWGVDHNPYWIDLGGAQLGASVSVGVTLIASVRFFDNPRKVVGTPITP